MGLFLYKQHVKSILHLEFQGVIQHLHVEIVQSWKNRTVAIYMYIYMLMFITLFS